MARDTSRAPVSCCDGAIYLMVRMPYIHTLTAAPGMNDEEGEEEEEDEQDFRRKEEKPPDRSGGGWFGGGGGGGGGDSSSGSSLPVSRESSGSESNLPLKRGRGRPPRKRPLEGACAIDPPFKSSHIDRSLDSFVREQQPGIQIYKHFTHTQQSYLYRWW